MMTRSEDSIAAPGWTTRIDGNTWKVDPKNRCIIYGATKPIILPMSLLPVLSYLLTKREGLPRTFFREDIPLYLAPNCYLSRYNEILVLHHDLSDVVIVGWAPGAAKAFHEELYKKLPHIMEELQLTARHFLKSIRIHSHGTPC